MEAIDQSMAQNDKGKRNTHEGSEKLEPRELNLQKTSSRASTSAAKVIQHASTYDSASEASKILFTEHLDGFLEHF